MSKSYHGSCLCGAVTFKVSGFSKKAAHCHCTMCRKFHGAAFGTLVEVHGLTWLSGKAQLKEFTAPSNGAIRSFCQHCGSSIGFRCKGQPLEEMELAIATFDEPIPVTIDANIYTQYKANWHEILEDVPQHPEGRDS
ncbi:GFA family protein [Thaumasiovibrio subtropicus]|uniref:GFA family protein n=1 Tax=Thaumasiovibrio subtropicus TaxID=1891207 RepID=UPI000B350DFA|nr:GFA family protein [Thaumasiovibrio subtropicus]